MNAVFGSAMSLAAMAALLQPVCAAGLTPLVTSQPDPPVEVAPYFVADTDARWSSPEWSKEDIETLRQKVKYVFVIFNENRSFDHEYGTFPGVNGLYSDGQNPRSAADTPGFTQTYHRRRTAAVTVTVQPFLIGPQQNATFRTSTDHSHPGLAPKARRQRTACRRWTVRAGRIEFATRRRPRRRRRRRGQAVRAAGDGAHRLRHDPVLLAIRQPLHDLRQYLRHRRHAVHAERDRDDRRPIGRDAMGQAPERDVRSGPGWLHWPDQRHDQRQDLFRHGDARRARRSSTIRSPGGARSSTLRPATASRPRRRNSGRRPTSPRTSPSPPCR